MRIALIATSYPADPADASGHFVRAEARALAAEGHEVHVVAPAPWGEPGIVAHAAGGAWLFGWPGAVARLRGNPARLLGAAPFAARAVRRLRAIRAERVVAHWAVPCGWPLALAAAPAGFEAVCHGADVRLLLGAPAALRERAVAALIEAGRLRFVASALRSALAGSLPAGLGARLLERSWVEPPRVDVSEREEPTAVPFERYALVAARLVADKRVGLAIGAIALAPGWGLVVAGDGPERPALEGLAGSVAPRRVRFVGRVSRPRALGYLARAGALLHPSGCEAAPTAVLEALALGVPVVACEAGDVGRWASERLRVVAPEVGALAGALLDLGRCGERRAPS